MNSAAEKQSLETSRLELHHSILQTAMDGFWLADQQGRILEVNEAYCRMSGYKAQELLAMRISDLEAEETAAETDSHVRKVITQGEDRFESRHRRKDGSTFDVEVSVQYRPIEGGRMVVFLRDITERKMADGALRANEARLRAIIGSSPVPMALNDENQHITFLNPAFVETFGYTATDIPTLAEWWPQAYPDATYRARIAGAWQAELDRTKREGGAFSPLEVTVRCKNGTNKTVLASAAIASGFEGQNLVVLYDITERKRAEEALRKSEATLSEVIRSVPQSIFWKDRHSVYVGCNDVFARVAGLGDPRSIVGKTDFELPWLREEAEAYRADDQTVMESGQPKRHYVEPLHQADGTPLWIDVTKVPLRAADGQVNGVLGVFEDITERKRAETELRKSEAALKAAQRVAQVGNWSWDIQSDRLTWSDEMFRIFGVDPVGFSGDLATVVDRAIHPDDRAAVEAANRSVIERVKPMPMEYRVVQPDGAVRMVWAEPGELVLDPTGRSAVLSGIVQDITERKRTEMSLRKSEAQFAAAFDLNPLAANLVTLAAGRIIAVNERYCQFFGYAREEIIGRTVPELSMWEEPTLRDALMQRVRNEGSVRDYEARLRRKDGSVRDVLISVTVIDYLDAPEPVVLSMLSDVTGKKAMEAQLLQTQRMEVIGSLAGGIAHDLNNILAPIMLVGDLLHGKLRDPEDQETLEMALSGARRGADIIKQLLTFSRGQQGERVPVQVRYLILEMLKMMRETFPRDIDLKQHVPTNVWTVIADSTQLHQVLLNLCVNARDAMPSGGRLTITATNVSLAAGDVVLPSDRKPGPYVVIEVSDTGHGIPLEIQHRIFDLFFTTKPLGEGTGLGLSTVLGIVQNHGGFIRLNSTPGTGSSFKVYLPALPDGAEAMVETPPPLPVVHLSGQTILVVDDERSIRETTRILLERQRFHVLTAIHGDDAITQFLQHREEIKLVLTDVMMPVMNGVTLVRALRAIDPGLKIIAASGLGEATHGKELAALGVLEVLTKPYAGAELIAAVHRHLSNP
jgi:PAS domain S-box-containing protein